MDKDENFNNSDYDNDVTTGRLNEVPLQRGPVHCFHFWHLDLLITPTNSRGHLISTVAQRHSIKTTADPHKSTSLNRGSHKIPTCGIPQTELNKKWSLCKLRAVVCARFDAEAAKTEI